MTAITIAELSVEDFPSVGVSGTAKRRARVYIRDAAIAADETLDLSSYITGVADVEGIVFETDDGAVANTSSTWSTYTITFQSTGVYEGCFQITYS